MKKIFLIAIVTLLTSTAYAKDGFELFKYQGIFELGYNKGINGSLDRIDATYIHSFQITSAMTAGVGIGLDYDYKYESLAIPIYADIRSRVLDKKCSPTLGFKIGYSVNDVKGFFMNPSLGYQFNRIHISAGYVYYFSNIQGMGVTSEGVSFKLGFSF